MDSKFLHPTFLTNLTSRDGPEKHPAILIVEDDRQMQRLFDRVLRAVDGRAIIDSVTTAEEAKDLLDHSELDHYELVLADQFLNGTETGLDLWNHCRKKHPFVEFVLTSGTDIDQYLARFQNQNTAPIFMKKNQSPHLMQMKLSQALRHAKAMNPLRNLFNENQGPGINEAILENSSPGWRLALGLIILSLTLYTGSMFNDESRSLRELFELKEIIKPVRPLVVPPPDQEKFKIHDMKMPYPSFARNGVSF
jgi:CheY-like chemotaxis protein